MDVSGMSLNETRFLADIPLPAGVTIPELTQRNAPVVSIHAPRAEEPEPVAAEAVAAVPVEGAAPAVAGAPGAPGAAPPVAAPGAAPAAPGEAKKGEAKKGEEKKEAAPARKEGGKK
jgi:hypothetical protein